MRPSPPCRLIITGLRALRWDQLMLSKAVALFDPFPPNHAHCYRDMTCKILISPSFPGSILVVNIAESSLLTHSQLGTGFACGNNQAIIAGESVFPTDMRCQKPGLLPSL